MNTGCAGIMARIIPIRDLIELLGQEPKAYVASTYSRKPFYNAKGGRPISLRSAAIFLAVAREQIGAHIIGIQLTNGTIVYHNEALAQLRAERDLLAAELAKAQRQLDDLRHQQTPMGPRRFAAPISAIEGNHGGN